MIRKRKSKKTFAPPSRISDISPMVSPQAGNVVEVFITWKERVLTTYHFKKNQKVTLGLDESSDILLPGCVKKRNFIQVGDRSATILLDSQMLEGEFISKKGSNSLLNMSQASPKTGQYSAVTITDNQMVKINLASQNLCIYIRLVPDSEHPFLLPFLNFKSTETLGLLVAVSSMLFLAFYMSLIPPIEKEIEQKPREVIVKLNPPQPLVKKIQTPPSKKKPLKVIKKIKKKKPKIVKKRKVNRPKKRQKLSKVTKRKRGKSRPTALKKGGAIKTSKAKGSTPPQRKDVRSQGLLSVFAKKGTQSKLQKTISGAGQVQGTASRSRGSTGQTRNRGGGNLGGAIRTSGLDQRSRSSQTIDGVGRLKGEGGDSLDPSGPLGEKTDVEIEIDSIAGDFEGTINGEIVREVIGKNRRVLASCYERGLRKDSTLRGKITVRWEIQESRGVTKKVRVVRSSIGNQAVHNCFVIRIRNLRFPGAVPDGQKGVIFYTFNLWI